MKKMSSAHMKEYASMPAKKLAKHMKEEKALLKQKKSVSKKRK